MSCRPPKFGLTQLQYFLMVCVVSTAALGQQMAEDPVMTSWRSHSGVEECCDCHYAGQQNPLRRGSAVGQISRQIEASIWLKQDKHAMARQRIEPWLPAEVAAERQRLRGEHGDSLDVDQWVGPSNELSRQICDRLGFDVSTDEGYRQFREHCLTCHGGFGSDVQPRAFARHDHAQPGISCTYCHQIGKRADWIQQHRSSGEWRLLPLNRKAAAGMRPLESEQAQAALCADCHVGNLAENKFVTHAMYAAGHPPLPNFELQTFCESMPRHWQDPAEVYTTALADYEGRQAYFKLNYPLLAAEGRPSVDYSHVGWRTRKVLMGGVAARIHGVQLLSTASKSEPWEDFALYDCMACHHALRRNSARQRFVLSETPGRPRQLLWPMVLTRVAAEEVGLSAELDAAEGILATALDSQPFGDRTAMGRACAQMLDTLGNVEGRLASKTFDGAGPRNILWRLSEVPSSQLVDYLAARQVVWGLQQVARDVGDQDPAAWGIPTADADEWCGISTLLPSGRGRSIYPQYLAEELRRRAAYVPDDLSARLDEFRQRIQVRLPPPENAN